MANLNDITAFRRKRKNQRNFKRLGIFLIAVAVILAVWFNRDSIGDAIEELTISTSQVDVSFPLSLPGSATYSFRSFDSGLSLLTDTYLYVYTTNATQTLSYQHSYSNPVQKAGNKRVLLYDANSYEFSLYNKHEQVYEHVLDDKIVYGTLSTDEKAIIITSSTRYSNILYIYDQKGNWLYTRKFVDENAMQAQLSPDGRYLYLTTISVENGDVVSKLYCYDTTTTENAVWVTYIKDNSIPFHLKFVNDRLYVICDSYFSAYLASDGSQLGSYEYSGLLIDSAFHNTFSAILYRDAASNKTMLISFDQDCKVIGNLNLPANTLQVLTYGDFMYTPGRQNLSQYSSDLTQLRTIHLDEEFSQVLLVKNTAYLLGYDTVVSQPLNT